MAPSVGKIVVLFNFKKKLFVNFTMQKGHKKKAKDLIKKIQLQKFTI